MAEIFFGSERGQRIGLVGIARKTLIRALRMAIGMSMSEVEMAGHAIFVGTAGWTVPRAVALQFPAQGSGLVRYAQRFLATEINSTFWRRHQSGRSRAGATLFHATSSSP